MKKLFKFFGYLLCAVLALTVLPTVTSAASGGGISVSSDSLKPGDTFYIIITVPRSENADTAAIRAEFDASAFEVISWSPSLTNGMSNSGSGFIALTSANASRTIDLSSGIEFTAALSVRKNASNGNYPITLTNHSFSYVLDNGYDYKELWTPSTTTVYVTVKDSGSVITTKITTTDTTKTPSVTTVKNSSGADTTKKPMYNDDDPDEDDEPANNGGSYNDDPDDPDDPEDTFDPDDPEEEDSSDDTTSVPEEKHEIGITPVLGGISAGRVMINTKSRFFENDTDIKITNTVDAQNSASAALKDLGLSRHKYYPFDISVYDLVKNKTIKSLGNGYIDISIPVPDKLKDAGSDLAVYHITGSGSELCDSSVFTQDGIRMIRFRTDSFSPYMIVDMVGEVAGTADTNVYKLGNTSSSSDGKISTGGSDTTASGRTAAGTEKSGPINPNTGAAAAVMIPSALVGCAFLSRRIVKKRKRTKKYIEE